MKRFLITTALEETWRDDVPVLFLGGWCQIYVRKEKWQKMDAEVVPYHWDERKKLYQDYLYLQKLHEEIMIELSDQLNKLHNVNFSVRYWQILVGSWLGYFLQILFDRWAMLQKAISNYEIIGSRVILSNGYSPVPNDKADFERKIITDEWNEAIWGELLSFTSVPIEWVDRSIGVRDTSLREAYRAGYARKLKKILAFLLHKIYGVINIKEKYFFITTYLNLKQNILLQFKLGQLPFLWTSAPVPLVDVDYVARKQQLIPGVGSKNFPGIARIMLNRHMPAIYREGYQTLIKVTHKLPWTKNPKAIFTSNSWSSDDVFKAWAAEKVEDGTPLIIGQHGGNYGMALWSFTEDYQIAIANKYLTWGYSGENNQANLIAVGNFKNLGSSQVIDQNGVALLVEMCIPRTSYHMYSSPVAAQYLDYFEDQCRFVKALPAELQSKLVVRLYPEDYGWCQRERWQERYPYIRLDAGITPIKTLVSKSRLYISTYNATTYLESLFLNVPTIIFWNPSHWELRDSAKPFFERLKLVGIFHNTPEGAARQVERVWNDVDAWWNNVETQAIRIEFCKNYSASSNDYLGALVKAIAI